MDAETILLAKKFSGGADVSAAKGYMDEAKAAATQAATAAASIPNNVASTLSQLTQDMAALETAMENIEVTGVHVNGNTGDVVRVAQDGSVYAGERPITQLVEAMVPEDLEDDTSGVTWIADANDGVAGFVLTADRTGKTIDSYAHDTYLLTITNTVNEITNERMDARTIVMDINYATGSSEEKDKRTGNMYNVIPYGTAHQVVAVVGINAAGCAYIDMSYGTSQTKWQYFPANITETFERRYQREMGTSHVKAVSVLLQNSTFKYGTMIRLWKM